MQSVRIALSNESFVFFKSASAASTYYLDGYVYHSYTKHGYFAHSSMSVYFGLCLGSSPGPSTWYSYQCNNRSDIQMQPADVSQISNAPDCSDNVTES